MKEKRLLVWRGWNDTNDFCGESGDVRLNGEDEKQGEKGENSRRKPGKSLELKEEEMKRKSEEEGERQDRGREINREVAVRRANEDGEDWKVEE